MQLSPPPELLEEELEELEEELQDLQDEYLVVPPQVQDEAPEAFPQEQELYELGHWQLAYFPPQAVPTPCNGEEQVYKSDRQTHLSK